MLDEHRLFFLVGDVSGKGLAASLFMALAKSLLKSIALRGGGEPAEIVCAADAEIAAATTPSRSSSRCSQRCSMRAPGMCACTCDAGQQPGALPARRGAATARRVRGAAALRDCRLSLREQLALAPGGWLCAVSDGVTEAMNPRGEFYSAARLLATLAADGSSEPQAVLASVRQDVRRFAAGAEQSDDVTLVYAALERREFGLRPRIARPRIAR